jgi:hypothetical protein
MPVREETVEEGNPPAVPGDYYGGICAVGVLVLLYCSDSVAIYQE